MPVVDAQVHMARPGEGRWRRDDPATRGRGFLPDAATLLAEMDRVGVDTAVLVPPLAVGKDADNSWSLEAARAHPGRFMVMGRFRPEAPGAAARLAGWLEEPGMAGIRLSFAAHSGNHARLGDGSFDWFFAQCAEDGIALMMHVPGMAGALRRVAGRYPELRLIVDHLGLTGEIAPAALPAALAPVLALADFPNVAVKASALPVYVAERPPFPGIARALHTVIGAFGAARVFWGSDLSHLRHDYADLVAFFRDGLEFLSGEERALVLGEGLVRWLDWGREA